MIITKYGFDVVIKFLLIATVLIAGSVFVVQNDAARYTIILFVAVTGLFVMSFFRDPERTPSNDERAVFSPADGKVVSIKEVFEPEYLNQDAVQVSIFMSPFNVHVNRFPISGTVGYYRYVPGDYLVAFEEKSSERNERAHIGVERDGCKVLFKQIAGAVARRIVSNVKVGQHVVAGERFGMIKFGSRVDVILPRRSELKISLHEKVSAGETVLAKFGSEERRAA